MTKTPPPLPLNYKAILGCIFASIRMVEWARSFLGRAKLNYASASTWMECLPTLYFLFVMGSFVALAAMMLKWAAVNIDPGSSISNPQHRHYTAAHSALNVFLALLVLCPLVYPIDL
ncbi:hypothetical protein [Leisingera caerulea]|uniref:Uncharacterized protein n=1 Tax=Leisingera caerulea TaxID=506591 RepID=A0A9Q9HK48_LEICA|nr:hypothetical protein [Leisingera caerulea]UWQ55931.1 hypothetical protein K3721_19035 [Leisingera caerulea]